MTTSRPRIALDPNVLAGRPVIRGALLSVEFIIGLMAGGWSEMDILANYQGLSTRTSWYVSTLPMTPDTGGFPENRENSREFENFRQLRSFLL